MTTFDDDMVRVHFSVGTFDLRCKDVGLEWPPPKLIVTTPVGLLREATTADEGQFVMARQNYSKLDDETVAGIEGLIRGAEYRYLSDPLCEEEE